MANKGALNSKAMAGRENSMRKTQTIMPDKLAKSSPKPPVSKGKPRLVIMIGMAKPKGKGK